MRLSWRNSFTQRNSAVAPFSKRSFRALAEWVIVFGQMQVSLHRSHRSGEVALAFQGYGKPIVGVHLISPQLDCGFERTYRVAPPIESHKREAHVDMRFRHFRSELEDLMECS